MFWRTTLPVKPSYDFLLWYEAGIAHGHEGIGERHDGQKMVGSQGRAQFPVQFWSEEPGKEAPINKIREDQIFISIADGGGKR